MEKKRIILWMMISIISLVLLGLFFWKMWIDTPYYDDTVLEYSNQASRVGNNIYGYIDVPKGFVMAGSFDEKNENYAGKQDGIQEGVHLYDPSGKACITVSLLTADQKQEDYIGLGLNQYFTYGKKERLLTAEKAWRHTTDRMVDRKNLVVEKDGAVATGSLVEINGLLGMSCRWDLEEEGEISHYLIYFIENPERKNTIHCITARYKTGYEECLDSLSTFSLKKENEKKAPITGIEERVGSPSGGYMNIPEGYYEASPWAIVKWMDDREKSSDLHHFIEKEREKKNLPIYESIIMGSFTKSEEYDSNLLSYMQKNITDVFGSFYCLDYLDFSNVELEGEDSKFGAKAFVSVMAQCLGEHGSFAYAPVTLGEEQGYKVTWAGRDAVDYRQKFLSFYILDSADDENVVYIVGACDRDGEGQFWKYLESFSPEY